MDSRLRGNDKQSFGLGKIPFIPSFGFAQDRLFVKGENNCTSLVDIGQLRGRLFKGAAIH
jgi:hypothetical protein